MNGFVLAALLNGLPDEMIVSANTNTYASAEAIAEPSAAKTLAVQQEIRELSAPHKRHFPYAFSGMIAAACLLFAVGFGAVMLRGNHDELMTQSSREEVEEVTAASAAITTTSVSQAVTTTAEPVSGTQRGIVTLTTAEDRTEPPAAAAADSTGTVSTDTVPTTVTTTAVTEESKQSESGIMIDGVFYQKGDFNMDGVIDLRDVYEMSALYWEMLQGGYRARSMRSEQLALGDIVDWAPMVTEHTGLDQTYLLPYDTNDTAMLRRYVCVHHMDSAVTLEAFVHLSNEERTALMNDFYRQYKTVSVLVADGNEVSDGAIVPLEAADGLYDHFGGTFYLCGDINMNGELDEEDAGLAEQIYASRGNEFPLVQLLLANITRTVCRYDAKNNLYHDTEYLQITGAEKAQLIRDYIRLRDMGTALPEALYDFYEQREAGAYDAQLNQ